MNLRGAGSPWTESSQQRGASLEELSLDLTDPAEARRCFEALAASGKVIQPLFDAPWGALFGVVADELGIHWMFNCATKPAS